MKRYFTIGAVAIGLVLSSCGGDEKKATTSPAGGDRVGPPGESAPPPSAAGQFPPQFLKCMADQGVDIKQTPDLHSPGSQQAFQACVRFLHAGSGGPPP
jgi:hypothetical protein